MLVYLHGFNHFPYNYFLKFSLQFSEVLTPTNTQINWTYLAGVQSSSQISDPKHVSTVDNTQSPNGTVFYIKKNSQYEFQSLTT